MSEEPIPRDDRGESSDDQTERSGGDTPAETSGETVRGTGSERPPASPPEGVVEEAERLTRLAREAAVEEAAAAYRERRDGIVSDHDFTARVRGEDDTLVLYPEEWVEDGVVQFEQIEDTDRAAEVSLSGPDHGAEWETVEAANQAIVDAVESAHGPDHAANVRAFADFMSNHYVKRVDDATEAEREEFLTEYYQRNAWPSEAQESIVAKSVDLVDDVGDDVPGP